jgi:peptide/nickel transport system permease protein
MVSSETADVAAVARVPRARRVRRPGRAGRVVTWVAGAVALAIIALAVAGPWFAPYGHDEIVGGPYMPRDADFALGTDYLGEDVWSRVLHGGRSVVVLATLATLIGYSAGLTVGLVAGLSRGWVDAILMRIMDVVLAFPGILVLLLLIAGLGTGRVSLVAGIAVLQVPFVARIIRAATAEVATKPYVEAAVVRGERRSAVLFREILPNISGVVVASAGPALTVSVLIVAGVSYLGLGLQAPDADWALMISENRAGMTLQPLAVLVPVLLIATLTISVNVLADGVARSLGRSVDEGLLR